VKGRVCEVCLGRRGRSSYGEGVRGMRNCCPTTSEFLKVPWIGFCMRNGHNFERSSFYVP